MTFQGKELRKLPIDVTKFFEAVRTPYVEILASRFSAKKGSDKPSTKAPDPAAGGGSNRDATPAT